jgi:hypothetical protein
MNKIPVLIFLLLCSMLPAAAPLEVKLDKVFDIGKKDIIFSDKVSAAEDNRGNLYVLDAKLHKIFKFSGKGQFIKAFGRKGRGPGDLYRPTHIAVSENNRLMISDVFSVSVMDLNGECLEKHNASRGGILWNKKYAGGNKVLALKPVTRTDAPPLVLVTLVPEARVINHNVLTCTSPKLYKEAIITHEGIAPEIWYAYSSGRSAVALSERYLVKVLNGKGLVETTIKKDIKNPPLSRKEREFIIETEINSWKQVDQAMKNGLKTTIPDVKTLITGVILSENMIFVKRTGEDITVADAPVLVDIYSIDGDFRGAVRLKSFPILTTDRHFYFKEETEDGEIIISKYAYKIKT